MPNSNAKILWAEMRRGEIEQAGERGCVALVPVGSIEQHGAHLPVDTDISNAFEVSQAVARKLNHVIVAPPVWWGFSPEWMSFGGTISLRSDTFLHLLGDICDSIARHGFRRIVIVNGHGSNTPLLSVVVNDFILRNGFPIISVTYWEFAAQEVAKIRRSRLGGMGHAGELETSLQLLCRPSLVAMEDAVPGYVGPKSNWGVSIGTPKDMFDYGFASVSRDRAKTDPIGVMGDPTVADAGTGRAILDAVIDGLTRMVEEYRESHFI